MQRLSSLFQPTFKRRVQKCTLDFQLPKMALEDLDLNLALKEGILSQFVTPTIARLPDILPERFVEVKLFTPTAWVDAAAKFSMDLQKRLITSSLKKMKSIYQLLTNICKVSSQHTNTKAPRN